MPVTGDVTWEDQPHHVASVVAKLDDAGAGLDIPEHARHVAGRGDDLAVVKEAAAAEVARVGGQLAGATDAAGALACAVEVVDRADVVETAAGDEVTGGGVRARHDPARAERDRVHLVGGVRVPDDELAVLRRGDEVAAVSGPVHGVDLGQVAAQCPARPHHDAGKGVDLGGHGADWAHPCQRPRPPVLRQGTLTARVGQGLLFGPNLLLELLGLAAGGGNALLNVGLLLRHRYEIGRSGGEGKVWL
jgi:hypothetical protein